MAEIAGQIAAEEGFLVVTGGRGGVMEAAAVGAHRVAGSLTLGLLPSGEMSDGNPHLDIVIPTGIGYARNSITALAGDVMVALPGGQGTLQEMSFAHDYGRPVLSWDSWTCIPGVRVVDRDNEMAVRDFLREHFARLSAQPTKASER